MSKCVAVGLACFYVCLATAAFTASAAVNDFASKPPARTTLSNPALHFTVPDKPYVLLRRGPLEVVVVDNRAVDTNDMVIPGHRAGYHGIASLKHERQSRNIFLPGVSGLNFEHIHDGTTNAMDILFEPRRAPMELRVINSHTAELYQSPTPHWGLESCMHYELLDSGVIELTFECIPRRDTYKNGYIGLFWASYIDQPESLDIHFLGCPSESQAKPDWVRGVTPDHGVLSTHPGLKDNREFAHDEKFPLTLVFNFSPYRYAEPWYLGYCRGMAFAQLFRPQDQVRFSQSPSGGNPRHINPAWDFQWFIPNYKLGQRYQLVMRGLYTVHEGSPPRSLSEGRELLKVIHRAQRWK